MAFGAGQITTRGPDHSLDRGPELPIARLVAVVLLLLAMAAVAIVANVARDGPSEQARQIAAFNPKQMLGEQTPHFLPPPVAAMPPDTATGPPPSTASEPAPAAAAERVKVANTGGVGAILRAEPPSGRPIGGLRDGAVLEVLDRRAIGDTEWLRVRTAEGAEGWIFARLVGPAQ
ncbi:MAG: SH3 domain-containing protein [Chloroflexota bacterium]|nr:SH3 domain-containing protein [Chloroflexota bacterium]